MKTRHLKGTEKTVSERGRKGRKSVKRRKRRRRSVRRNGRRRRNARESGNARGRETENGTEIETGTGGHGEATQTAVTPVERQTGKGAGPVIAGGPGAETRRGRGSANAAGMLLSFVI